MKMLCKICQKECETIFNAVVLKKYNANYLTCTGNLAKKLNLEYVQFFNLHIFCKRENVKKIKIISKLFRIKFMSKIYIKILKKSLKPKTFTDHLKISER